jgi:hypothetical protein
MGLGEQLELEKTGRIDFETTAQKDRHYICKIGALFWGNDKQCYAADAVYHMVKKLVDDKS